MPKMITAQPTGTINSASPANRLTTPKTDRAVQATTTIHAARDLRKSP